MTASSFDRFFHRVCEASGIRTQQELATLLGVNRSAITQAKTRGVAPEAWLFKLARDYGYSLEWLESGQGAPNPHAQRDFAEFVQVPKVKARLCAGGGSFDVSGEVEDYFAFRRSWAQRKGDPMAMVMMDIFGASMEPELREGDTVLLDQSQSQIIAGQIYAVGVEDTVMVKRIEKRPHGLALLSENPNYSALLLQGDELETVRVIGKVVWVCREYR
jgi:phage repressor protein C with HTH and peptisase S24 domain